MRCLCSSVTSSARQRTPYRCPVVVPQPGHVPAQDPLAVARACGVLVAVGLRAREDVGDLGPDRRTELLGKEGLDVVLPQGLLSRPAEDGLGHSVPLDDALVAVEDQHDEVREIGEGAIATLDLLALAVGLRGRLSDPLQRRETLSSEQEHKAERCQGGRPRQAVIGRGEYACRVDEGEGAHREGKQKSFDPPGPSAPVQNDCSSSFAGEREEEKERRR